MMTQPPAADPGGSVRQEGSPLSPQQEALELILANLAVELSGSDIPPRLRALAEELQTALDARERERQKD